MIERLTPLAFIPLALAAGCSDAEPTTLLNGLTNELAIVNLAFDQIPEGNLSVADCKRSPHTFASYINSEPQDAKLRTTTVGLVDSYVGGRPIIELGATVRYLGGGVVAIVTSDNDASVISLGTGERYARVIDGENGYDGVVAVTLGEDGNAYVVVNCLPEFEHSKNSPGSFSPGDSTIPPPNPQEETPPPPQPTPPTTSGFTV